MSKPLAAAVSLALIALSSAPALASCRIHNDTKWDFKVESGNTSNQSVGAHTETSIAAGKIIGKDEKTGKSISGFCKDGDTLEVKEDHDIAIMAPK